MTSVAPPTEVRIGPHTYVVHWDEEAWDRLRQVEDGLGYLMGRSNHHTCEIWIRPGLSESQLRDTLLHEILHAIFGSGIQVSSKNVNPTDQEEYTVSSVTPWLLGVLRDNAGVLAYLTS